MNALDRVPKPINLLYSIDYELFWTHNDDEVRVLVQPTERLLRQAEELGVRYTLFVDVLCLFRYRELGLHRFVDAVEDQLRDAVRRGHDVQTHLHPHWTRAERKDGIWSFDNQTFLLGNLGGAGAGLQQDQGIADAGAAILRRAAQTGFASLSHRSISGWRLRPSASCVGGAEGARRNATSSSRMSSSGCIAWQGAIGSISPPCPRVATGSSGPMEAPSRECLGPAGGADPRRNYRFAAVPLADGDVLDPPDGPQARVPRRFRPFIRRGWRSCRPVGSVRQSWSRKFRILTSRWSRLAIPTAPIPTLKNLTENWIRTYVRDGPVAFSMLLHSKTLTQGRGIDDVRSYTQWVQSHCRRQVAFLTFLELAHLLEGGVQSNRGGSSGLGLTRAMNGLPFGPRSDR